MVLDPRWEALLNPGRATSFFALPHAGQFEPEATAYSPVNAWWLAELSRLIYKQEKDEVADFQGHTRRELLNAAGLEEVRFIRRPLAQCAVVQPSDPAAPPFAVLVFRGSYELRSWLTNLQSRPVEWRPHPGRVHQGFKDALECVVEEIDAVLGGVAGPVFYTGHSLGAALATLAAAWKPPRAVYAFGSPRVGDQEFLQTLGQTKLYRVVNSRDVVPTLPPAQFGFAHGGELRYITREGKILVAPAEDPREPRRFFEPQLLEGAPPEDLADHAPLDYVTRLRAVLP